MYSLYRPVTGPALKYYSATVQYVTVKVHGLLGHGAVNPALLRQFLFLFFLFTEGLLRQMVFIR